MKDQFMTLLKEQHPDYDDLHSHHQGQSRALYGPWHLCTFDLANHLQPDDYLDVTGLGKVEPDESGEGGQPYDIVQLGTTLDDALRDENFIKPVRITLFQCKRPELLALLAKWGEEQGVSTSNPD